MIEHVVAQRRRDLGGFEVGRVLPAAPRRMVGPFVFFDHMGPVDFPPGIPRTVDVRPHPHIGLSTVTYLFDGEIMHRDSLGSEQAIRPGEVNWMTAGRGITHSERFERARRDGDRVHGIQAWVGLPREQEESEPAFRHVDAARAPDVRGGWAVGAPGRGRGLRREGARSGALADLLRALGAGAGDAGGPGSALSGARGVCRAGLGRGRRPEFRGGPTARLRTGRADRCSPRSRRAIVMLLGGEPIGERFIEWNFVSSSKERIAQAKADWRAGRMKLPVHDDAEFVPLPPDAA